MNSAISDLLLTFSIGAATILLGHLVAWTFTASRRSFPDRLIARVSVLKKLPATIAVLLPISILFGLGALIRSIECADCGLVAPLDLIPALCVLAWVFRLIFTAILLWALATWIYWFNRASKSKKKKASRATKKRERSQRMLLRSFVIGTVLCLFYLVFCSDCGKNNSACDQGASPICTAESATACTSMSASACASATSDDCATCAVSDQKPCAFCQAEAKAATPDCASCEKGTPACAKCEKDSPARDKKSRRKPAPRKRGR